jgi:hypothetical protein
MNAMVSGLKSIFLDDCPFSDLSSTQWRQAAFLLRELMIFILEQIKLTLLGSYYSGPVRIQGQMAKGQMVKFLLLSHQMFGR